MDYNDDIFTTLTPEINVSTESATLRLYDIFIPILGIFIISLNLLVVISSGLLLKKRKIWIEELFVCVYPFISMIRQSNLIRDNLFFFRSTAEIHIPLPWQHRLIRSPHWNCSALWPLLSDKYQIRFVMLHSDG